jgi:hypothetical protein
MTQPPNTPINWGFGLVKAADGKHWISCTIGTPLATFNFAMPPAMWQETASKLPAMLTELVAQANRADLGLEIAPAEALNKIKQNGGPNVRVR